MKVYRYGILERKVFFIGGYKENLLEIEGKRNTPKIGIFYGRKTEQLFSAIPYKTFYTWLAGFFASHVSSARMLLPTIPKAKASAKK